jgi:hypothetical protein
MKAIKKEWIFVLTVMLILFTIEPTYAGPGGFVAKALFKTWYGKLLLLLVTIIFLPLIIYIRLIEYRKARKIKKILLQLSSRKKEFAWINLQKEFTNIVRRVYNAWSNEDMSEVKNYVNHWYWQNQQQVYLDQWKRDNVVNISRIKEINSIKPLYLELTEEDDYEGSRIAVLISVDAEDYLKERDSDTIVQGKKGYETLEYVWFLEYTEGKWLLDDIQEGNLSLQIAKIPDVIPSGLGVMV